MCTAGWIDTVCVYCRLDSPPESGPHGDQLAILCWVWSASSGPHGTTTITGHQVHNNIYIYTATLSL